MFLGSCLSALLGAFPGVGVRKTKVMLFLLFTTVSLSVTAFPSITFLSVSLIKATYFFYFIIL